MLAIPLAVVSVVSHMIYKLIERLEWTGSFPVEKLTVAAPLALLSPLVSARRLSQ